MLKVELKKLLQVLHDDLDGQVSFIPMDREWYLDQWQQRVDQLEYKVPDFYCSDIELKDTPISLFKSHFINAKGKGLGFNSERSWMLTGLFTVRQDKFYLEFHSLFSNWPMIRLVGMNSDGSKICRNDFKATYKLKEKDFEEGKYQRKKKISLAEVSDLDF